MVLSRRWSAFLVLVGVWTWLIWPRFGLAIWQDDRSFADGEPTSFLGVHALLIGASRRTEEIAVPDRVPPKD